MWLRPWLLCLSVVTSLWTYRAQATDMQPIQEVFEPARPAGPNAMVAVLQWAPPIPAPVGITPDQAEQFKAQNRAQIEAYVRQAAAHGAKMVITSEFGIVGYPLIPGMPPEETDFRNRDDIAPYVETVPGPSTDFFSKLARELKIYLHIGFAEVDAQTNEYFNTVVALDPEGKIVAKYRKANLYQLENNFLSPGHDISTYNSPFGKIGIIICADVYSRFPMDAYKAVQVDVLALSTSWAVMNTGMAAFTSGAQHDQVFLLAANQQYFPDSGVINPDGSTQSHIRQTNGLAYGYLPLKVPSQK